MSSARPIIDRILALAMAAIVAIFVWLGLMGGPSDAAQLGWLFVLLAWPLLTLPALFHKGGPGFRAAVRWLNGVVTFLVGTLLVVAVSTDGMDASVTGWGTMLLLLFSASVATLRLAPTDDPYPDMDRDGRTGPGLFTDG